MTDAIRPITLDEIRSARDRIAGTILRTPLVRLELGQGAPDIRLKLENLQPINAYKLRGAANAVALLPDSERRRGVWTVSAGNAGQGVAYAAMKAGVPCTVVAIESAPVAKIERMKALGARIVPVSYARAWQTLEDRAYPGVEGTFIHPFDDHNFIAGNATMGLEILEDAPGTAAVIGSIGGGGLVVGVASAVKALKSTIRVYGAEPETAAPAALSFAAGSPQIFSDWKASFVDGAGGQSMFPRMWQRMQGLVDGSIVVSLEETQRAMRLLAEKTRVVAEGAGALALAAALGAKAPAGPIVVIISGGNIDLAKFCELIAPEKNSSRRAAENNCHSRVSGNPVARVCARNDSGVLRVLYGELLCSAPPRKIAESSVTFLPRACAGEGDREAVEGEPRGRKAPSAPSGHLPHAFRAGEES